jgi:hypothetical protein
MQPPGGLPPLQLHHIPQVPIYGDTLQIAAGVSTVVAISVLLYLSGYVPVVCLPWAMRACVRRCCTRCVCEWFVQGHEHYIPLAAYLVLLLLWINPLVCWSAGTGQWHASPYAVDIITVHAIPMATRQHVMQRNARYWLLRVLGRVLVAPFAAVNFADFWLADQFCSLTEIFLDVEFTVCHYWHIALYPDGMYCMPCCIMRAPGQHNTIQQRVAQS